MREYQAVIMRLQQRSREDEEAVTDLLNERTRMGWTVQQVASLETGRLLLVFARET